MSAKATDIDTMTASNRLIYQRRSSSTIGASRKVRRMASASGMNTSSASLRTATTTTTVSSAMRVVPAARTRPFMRNAYAGNVPGTLPCKPSRRSARRCRRQTQLELLEAPDLIAQRRGLLELEVARSLVHLRLEFLDLPDELLGTKIRDRCLLAGAFAPHGQRRRRAGPLHDVHHSLVNP